MEIQLHYRGFEIAHANHSNDSHPNSPDAIPSALHRVSADSDWEQHVILFYLFYIRLIINFFVDAIY
jgi:hypothetical protein